MNTKDVVKELVRRGARLKIHDGEIELWMPGHKKVTTSHWSRRKDASERLLRLLRRTE